MKKKIISLCVAISLLLAMLPHVAITASAENKDSDSGLGELNEEKGYIPAVLNAIEDAQSFAWGNGYGTLFDIDGNGIEELIMVYSVNMETDDGYGLSAKACSLYTMSNGNAIQLIDKEILFAEAGGPSGCVAVVELEGNRYFAITAENGETGGGRTHRGGDWKLYTISGTSIELDTNVEYEYYEGDTIEYDRSFATINGNKCGYREYEEWRNRLKYVLQVQPYEDESAMTLEELLEYLKRSYVTDEPTIPGGNTTKRLVKIIQTMSGYEDTTEYTFTYNEWNLPARIHQSYSSDYERTVEYTYDNEGRFIRYGDSEENVYTYDSNGRLTKYVERVGDMVATYTYFYDAEGKRERAVCNRWGVAETTKYFYDKNGRLEQMQNDSGSEYYTYDSMGLLQKAQSEYATTTYAYNTDGQLESTYTEYNHPTMVITHRMDYDYESNAPFFVAHGEGTSSELWIEDTAGHTIWSLSYTRSTAYTGDLIFETDQNGLVVSAEDDVWTWEFVYEDIQTEQSSQTPDDVEEKNDIYRLEVYTVDRNLSIETGKKLQLICVLYCNDELVEDWNGVSWGMVKNPDIGDIITVSDHREIDVGYSLYVEGLQQGTTNLTITEGKSGAHITLEISVYDDWAMPVGCYINNVPSILLDQFGDYGTQVNFYNYSGLYVTDFPENPTLEDGDYHLEFNVYNSSYMHGSVDVYSEDREWIGSQKINKNENVRDVVGTMYDGMVAIGEWVTGKSFSFKASTYSTKTEISIDVPEGGYFVISNNVAKSPGVFLYNGIDYYLQLLSVANNLEFSKNNIEQIEEVTIETLKTGTAFMDEFIDSYSKIMRGMAIQSSADIMEFGFVDKISGMIEIVKAVAGSAIDLSISITTNIAEDTLKKMIPKEVSVWLDTLFGISEATDSLGQAIDICMGVDDSYIVIYTPEASTHMTVEGVSAVPSKNALPDNAMLSATQIPYEDVSIQNENVHIDDYQVYNICYSVNGADVQPNGMVRVQIPIPNGYDENECIVLHQQEDGTWEVKDAEFENGYAIVEVSHFSLFAIVRGYLIDAVPERSNALLWIIAGIAVICFIVFLALRKKAKKKNLLIILPILVILSFILVIILHHEHTWRDATCAAPKTCSECGETEGTALDHQKRVATCNLPETCILCGETFGAALGHTWVDATCTAPQTCSICGETNGDVVHQWVDATYENPKTCELCGLTEGSKLIPDPVYINELDVYDKYGKLWTMSNQKPDYYVHTDVNDAEDYKDMDTPGHTTGPVYDYLGNSYTYGLHIDGDEYSAYFVSYDIGGIYSTFTGAYCMSPDMDGDSRASKEKYFEIYGDGVLLFRSVEISQGSAAKTFNIDVSGVEILTIRYPKTSGPSRIATIFDGKLS